MKPTLPTTTHATEGGTLLAAIFEGHTVRTFIDDHGHTWACAQDVCDVLGYRNHNEVISDHCEPKGVAKRYTLTAGGRQELLFLNEPNLLRLVIRSKKPNARRFEAWVFHELLPRGLREPAPAPSALDAETIIRLATESATAAVAKLLESRKAPERRREVIEGAGGVAIIRARSIRVSIATHTRFHERIGLLRDHGFRYDPARRRWIARHNPENHATALRAISDL